MSEALLATWTIYERPRDFPRWFVVRRFVIDGKSDQPKPDRVPWALAETLEGARAKLPRGLHCLPRQHDDDPKIVETWI